ncbi:glycerophosphocholine phosphodiesterase GPCPD1 isoform X2 [Bactrocera dorsalis]|uniref:Glycerophosphocholine phosphodiesterase GPCPD1 isoform X2 n=1 Tax=Bactrocera dorsalis TaxID=27457 RepID=A0A6I9UVW9_BACDO|nr:glycerophosphocholine phosphodiesterase GPCPD1 isoform X2 [Bactrocera dorsalis]
MHKNLQQRYLATLRKCATPMPTFVAQTVTTQPQRQPQVVQKQQQEIQTRSYTVSSPKRYALPRNFGQCFDCFHVAAVRSVALNSSRPHGTSATKATATPTTPQTTTRTPVTTITVTAAVDGMTASADMADFLITNTTKITSANQQTRDAECASYVDAATIVNELLVLETAAETTPCTPTLQQFAVELYTDLGPSERVGLTGDVKALGEWRLERAIALEPQQGDRRWQANVLLQTCRNISYRYFIYVEDKQGRKQIRRWETRLQPRVLKPAGAESPNSETRIDRFGDADGSGETQVNRGWLTNDCIVQLKFEREQMFQVLDIEKFDPADEVLVKILPLNEEGEPTEAGVHVEVAKLKYAQSHLQPQQAFGIAYEQGDIVVFHITAPCPLQTAFAIIFHTPDQRPVGKAVITAAQLEGSEGVLELSITEPVPEATTVIARLTLPYLIVKPFADKTLDFRTTYAHYWPRSWPNLNVGHRGNGRSYIANPPAERENTIASFMRAYEKFADMIELDVHLTADGVPVIYHDFGMRTAPQGKNITKAEQLQYVLIKDINYEKLKQLRVFAIINGKPVEFPSHNAEPRVEHRIFPTLVDVLEGLPKSLGIDVEIKWPQRRASGAPEAHQTIDKNFFTDRVLATVINHGCGRPLLFSSFDADICTMLRFKQNLFPVMFLTQGQTKKWSPFMDLRTRTVEQAINNAQAFELAGTAPHAEDLLSEEGAQLLQKARDLGQISLVWGDDCNSKERVQYFVEIGATATCYDRTDLYIPEGKERAFFNSSSLLAEFEEQCLR